MERDVVRMGALTGLLPDNDLDNQRDHLSGHGSSEIRSSLRSPSGIQVRFWSKRRATA